MLTSVRFEQCLTLALYLCLVMYPVHFLCHYVNNEDFEVSEVWSWHYRHIFIHYITTQPFRQFCTLFNPKKCIKGKKISLFFYIYFTFQYFLRAIGLEKYNITGITNLMKTLIHAIAHLSWRTVFRNWN